MTCVKLLQFAALCVALPADFFFKSGPLCSEIPVLERTKQFKNEWND